MRNTTPEIEIAGRLIGQNHPPLVIAEIGINHEGSLNVAKEMVNSAVKAGVELIKHQTHIVDDEMADAAKTIKPGNSDVPIYSIMERCALNEEEELELKEYTEKAGLIFLSTPFSRAAVDRLDNFNVPAFKIGSGECNNLPLLSYIANLGKPIIMSTGMNSLESVQRSVDILKSYGVPYALLHTTNLYPTPDHLVRLGAMSELAEHFPEAVYGLSDHSLSNHACFGAVAMGASILERHYTDFKNRTGPDIICSMDESDFVQLKEGCEILWKQRGGKKGASDEEKVTMDFAFSSVCAIRNINLGEEYTMQNIWVKRPGTGDIPAHQFDSVLGKKAFRNIENGKMLERRDID